MTALPVTNLQDAYDAAPLVPQVTIDATPNPVTLDASVVGDIFALRDTANADIFRGQAGAINTLDFGLAAQRTFELHMGIAGQVNGFKFLPDDFTQILAAAGPAISWTSTVTSLIPGGGGVGNDTAPAMIQSIGEVILNDQGNLFSTSLLFNQATTISCNGFNSGPLYTLVNQPLIRNIGGGTRTCSQANAVRSQFRIGPNTSGNITQISHDPFFATVTVNGSVGLASITTLNYFAPKAPNLVSGGTVGTLHCFDIPNIPIAGIGTLVGLNSAMAAGTFINHTGVAPSVFAGDIRLNDDVELQLGTTSGAFLSRQAPSGFVMQGFGGANNEGLDFDFQNVNFVQITPTAGGLGISMNSLEFAFGSGATPDGTNNWVMIFAPGLRATSLAGDYSEVLFSSASSIAVAHAISNFATWTVNAPSITIAGGSIVNAANVLIQTSMGQGTNRYGLLVTTNPSGGTLNYAARFTGATGVRIDGLLEHTGTLLGFYGVTPVVQAAAYTPTNVSTDRAYDANATSVDELADVLGTLIADLQAVGLIQ